MALVCAPQVLRAGGGAAPHDRYGDARRLLDSGDYARAEAELLRMLGQSPNDAEICFLLGVLYTRRTEYDKGRQFLLQALHLRPGSVPILNDLGVNALERRQEPEAERYFRRALSIDAGDVDALFNLGLIGLKHKRFQAAAQYLQQAAQRRPNDNGVLQALLAAELELRQEEEVLQTANRLLAQAPRDQAAYLRLAALISGKECYRAARALMERAHALWPLSDDVSFNLALVDSLAGEWQSAREVAEAQVAHQPRADFYNLLAEVYENQKLYDRAADAYRTAVRLDPENPEYHFGLAYEFLIHHNFDLAEQLFTASIRKFPQAPKLRFGLSAVYIGRGQYAEAAVAIRQAIDVSPESPAGYLLLGQALTLMPGDPCFSGAWVGEKLKKYVQLRPTEAFPYYVYALYLLRENGAGQARLNAIGYLRKSLQLDPRLADAYFELGKVHLADGQIGPATRALERAVELKPFFPPAYYQLGRAYMKAGESEKASRAWQQHAQQQKQLERIAIEREKRTLRFVYTLK